LEEVILGPFVVFGGGESAIKANGHNHDGKRKGAEFEVLLNYEPANRCCDHQDVVC
jgi:hypothetical protein